MTTDMREAPADERWRPERDDSLVAPGDEHERGVETLCVGEAR